MNWEVIDDDSDGETHIEKARAPGGWLVRVVKREVYKKSGETQGRERSSTLSVTFVPMVMDTQGPRW